MTQRMFTLGLFLLVSVAGCGGLDVSKVETSAQASPAVSPVASQPARAADQPLLRHATEGGMCPYGECRVEVVIAQDGSFTWSQPRQGTVSGTVSPAALQALTAEIDRANYAAIKAKPFTGTCPIAYDGTEDIYTMNSVSGVHELRSCREDLDRSSPLFQAVAQVMAEVQQAVNAKFPA